MSALPELIARLGESEALRPLEIESAVEALTSAEVEDEQKARFLQDLSARGETAGELAGFAEAMLRRAVDPGIVPGDLPGPLVDVCGTGGDRSGLFNVSTTCMFVVAAAGAVVVKHGNRAVTSQCGGADVLEELGVRLQVTPGQLQASLHRAGAAFLFAPAFHPAFRAIAPVRARLAAQGRHTVFNLLGPLLNPARPAQQLVGVYALHLLPLYAEALVWLGRRRAWAVHGAGLDELSTTGRNAVEERVDGAARRLQFLPEEYGFAPARLEDLQGGNRVQNAAILLSLLRGEMHGAKRDLVVLNSGAALYVAGLAPDLPAAFELAREQIESGRALARLEALREATALPEPTGG